MEENKIAEAMKAASVTESLKTIRKTHEIYWAYE